MIWNNWTAIWKKSEGREGREKGGKCFLHTILRINIKCFITEIRSKTIKPLEESVGEQKCRETDHEFA